MNRLQQARDWTAKQEYRLTPDNIHRPNTEWVYDLSKSNFYLPDTRSTTRHRIPTRMAALEEELRCSGHVE